jgi:hypothetical protein
MIGIRSRRFPVKRILLLTAASIAVLVAALSIWGAIYAKPLLKARAVTLLAAKFHADVQMGDFDVSLFPRIRIHGRNLSLRQEGRTDVPPLIQVDEFLAVAGLGAFIGKPWKLDRVNLMGLKVTIPPLRRRNPQKRLSQVRDIPIFIHQISANNGLVEILSQHGASHLFIVRDLALHSVGLSQAAAFSTELINPTPLGFIHAAGSFGPWNSEEPGLTPLLSHYTLTDVNLSGIKGIGGTLSSQGQFGGVLNQMEVKGETDTPDFRVTLGGHPVSLHTTFSAAVDGTNGNTILHPVRAQFLHTTTMATGEIVKKPGARGWNVVLDLQMDSGRLEDLLQLGVKSNPPPMTGGVNLAAKFNLPPGSNDLVERLSLAGAFGVRKAEFTSPEVKEKVQRLSRKGLGMPKNEAAGSDVSNLQGRFQLDNGLMTFRDLHFEVEGAEVQIEGTYDLTLETLNFHGDLRLNAKLSQTMTGFKSILLKPFDGFFRKDGMTEIPIRITGTRSSPSFGLDIHHNH